MDVLQIPHGDEIATKDFFCSELNAAKLQIIKWNFASVLAVVGIGLALAKNGGF